MSFFLGIDGGGSKTECVLADEAGAMLARTRAPGTNLARTSSDDLRSILSTSKEQLRAAAGLPRLTCEAVCGGFAGASHAPGRLLAREIVKRLFQPRFLYVVGDMEVALEAAVGGGPGVVLIAGTGSIAYGRNQAGKIARAGGEGPGFSSTGEMVGDKGGAVFVGWKAIQAAPHLLEKPSLSLPSELREEIENPFQARPLGYDLLALARTVLAAAAKGDAAACEILKEAAGHLAELGRDVVRELGFDTSEVEVALSGGLFAGSEILVALVRERMLAEAPRARVERLRVSPAEGAVRMAQRLWLEAQAGG